MRQHGGEDSREDYPHKDITEAIIGAASRLQKALGPGLLEDAYKVCLAHALRLDGHKVLREVHLDITYEGLCVPNAYLINFHNWPLKDGGVKRLVNTKD